MYSNYGYQNASLSTSLTRFGSGGVVLRSRANQTLELEEIARRVPAIFADSKHESRSDKYTFIPTHDLLVSMMRENFLPVEVRQGGSRDQEKRAFTKHLIRFRQMSNTALAVNDTFPEVVLVNSHDGTSSYQVMSGWFRLVCLNGMTVAECDGPGIKVPHRGSVDNVIEASYRVVDDFAQQRNLIEDMRHTELSEPERQAFASGASLVRYEEGQVSPLELLRPRRSADQPNDLWTVFNRVQERLTQPGMLHVQSTNERGQTNVRRSRGLNSISDNVQINRMLWQFASEIQKVKQAA